MLIHWSIYLFHTMRAIFSKDSGGSGSCGMCNRIYLEDWLVGWLYSPSQPHFVKKMAEGIMTHPRLMIMTPVPTRTVLFHCQISRASRFPRQIFLSFGTIAPSPSITIGSSI